VATKATKQRKMAFNSAAEIGEKRKHESRNETSEMLTHVMCRATQG
jgi:hypothetical protein